MKTKILKIFTVICCLCALFSLTANAAYPSPTDKFFVNDYAGVLSSATEQTVFEQGKTLFEKTKAQSAVLIVNSLEGESIESYSMGVATKWELGDEKLDNGILLLIAVQEREIRIEVGYGLEGALPDGKVGLLMEEYAYGPLKQNDYDTAVLNLYDAITNEIYIEYGIEPDSDYTPASQLENKSGLIFYIIFLIIVVSLVFGRRGRSRFIFLPGVFGGHYRGGGFSGGGFRGGGGGFGGGGASGKF